MIFIFLWNPSVMALFFGLFFMFHEYSDGVHLLVDGFDGGMLLEDPVSF